MSAEEKKALANDAEAKKAATRVQALIRGRKVRASLAEEKKAVKVRLLPPVKLLDFGISQVCVDALDLDQSAAKKGFDDTILKATGTPAFYAPEMVVLPPKPFHGRPADVWAAGVTLCMIVTGHLPFEADNMPEVWRKIKEDEPTFPESMSPALRQMLTAMLAKRPEERPTVQALRAHPWVTNDGEDPMPEQPYLPLEITEDDIQKAVKKFGNTFTLMKAKSKWLKAARASAEARAKAESESAAALTASDLNVTVNAEESAPKSTARSTFSALASTFKFLQASPKSSVVEVKPAGIVRQPSSGAGLTRQSTMSRLTRQATATGGSMSRMFARQSSSGKSLVATPAATTTEVAQNDRL